MIKIMNSPTRPERLWHVHDSSNWLGTIDNMFSPIGKFSITIGSGSRSDELYDSYEEALNAFMAHVVAKKMLAS